MSQLRYRNKNQNLFLILYYNLSKKKQNRNGTLGVRIKRLIVVASYSLGGIGSLILVFSLVMPSFIS